MKGNKDFTLTLETFKDILYMEQESLHYYTLGRLESFFKKEDIYYIDEEFIYCKGDIPVLLCAHFDTVHKVKPTPSTLFHDQEKEVMWGLNGIGGDDRCGVFNILDILESGYRPHVIFSWDEEIGGVGASKFTENAERYFGKEISKKIDEIGFAIQFDRKGFGEAVYYELDSPDFEDYITKFGFKTEYGSYTDICEYCPFFGFAGVNVSTGYINEHTTRELVFLDEMLASRNRVIEILKDQIDSPQKFEYVGYQHQYYGGMYGSSYYGWGTDSYKSNEYYFDDISDGYDYPVDIEDDSTFMPEEDTFCAYCGQSKSVVLWSYNEDIVLNTLCDECKEHFRSETGFSM